MNDLKLISGLKDIKGDYDAFIVDIWGVIFEGEELYEGVVPALEELKRHGKKIVFLTNSSRRSFLLVDYISNLGIAKNLYDGLLSSGEVVHYELKEKTNHFYKNLGKKFFHLGPKRRTAITQGLDLQEVEDITDADFVLETGPLYEVEDLESYSPFLRSCVNRNLPMVCANPDRVTLRDKRLIIGSGSIANLYEKMGGFVSYKGKPHEEVFDYCIEGLGDIEKQRIAVIGDTMETDIAGANNAKLDSVFVMSGIHKREIVQNAKKSSYEKAISDLSRVYGFFPNLAMPSFVW